MTENNQPIGIFDPGIGGLAGVEEGTTEGLAVGEIARGYLLDFKRAKIDTLILGCTHYPLFQKIIAKTMGDNVKLIEFDHPAVKKLHEILQQESLLDETPKPEYNFIGKPLLCKNW